MLPIRSLLCLSVLFFSAAAFENILQILPSSVVGDDPRLPYCDAWRLAVETNNAGKWKKIPSRCTDIIEGYIKGPQYLLDSKTVARFSYSYAKTVKLAGDRKDVWVFDVDETLISNLQHYSSNGYGSKVSNVTTAFDQWIMAAKAPALPWSLWLYKKLQGMGFQLMLITGRKETHRNSTEHNLSAAGYHSWKQLILREALDADKTAMSYKSEKRAALAAKGYRIHGSSGDQWSDLMGSHRAKRSFKVPNPMYHIP